MLLIIAFLAGVATAIVVFIVAKHLNLAAKIAGFEGRIHERLNTIESAVRSKPAAPVSKAEGVTPPPDDPPPQIGAQ